MINLSASTKTKNMYYHGEYVEIIKIFDVLQYAKVRFFSSNKEILVDLKMLTDNHLREKSISLGKLGGE